MKQAGNLFYIVQKPALHHAGFLFDLLFLPEDEGDVFLRTIGQFSSNYTAIYPGRYNSS
jgi:hypothetical protein